MRLRFVSLIAFWVIGVVSFPTAATAAFTRDPATALKFGTHEIVFMGDDAVTNPFDTIVTVTFIPPSGTAHAVAVYAFYDGGAIWRARLYVTEVGTWQWTSTSMTDPGLNGKSGSFPAVDSNLPGMLKLHPANPKAWITEAGQPFLSISDTAWLLFNRDPAVTQNWQQFVQDDVAMGITVLGPVGSLESWGLGDVGHLGDNEPWVEGDYTRYDLAKFQNAESRLIWIFDNYPDLFLQSMLFGTQVQGNWANLPRSVRANSLRYLIARWSAFPNVFWLVSEDQDVTQSATLALNREVGQYFAANEPWKHLMSTQPNRFQGFPFTTASDLRWVSYLCVQDAGGPGADQIQHYQLGSVPRQVMLCEDYYEQDYGGPPSGYSNPRFYMRWSFWSWILAGGTYTYGGRYGVIHPYTQTWRPDLVWTGPGGTNYTGYPLQGLDSIPYLWSYFQTRHMDLGRFDPNDGDARKPANGAHPGRRKGGYMGLAGSNSSGGVGIAGRASTSATQHWPPGEYTAGCAPVPARCTAAQAA